MNKSRVLLCLLLAFITGVFVRSFWQLRESLYFFIFLAVVLILIIFYKNSRAALAAFIFLFFLLGSWKTNKTLQAADVAILNNQTIEGKALVIKNNQSKFGQNLIIEFKDLNKKESSEVIMLLKMPTYPSYAYGDLLDVSCTAKTIENKDASFDYRMYMAKEGILYSCENKKVNKIAANQGNFLLQQILRARTYFENKIANVIPAPYAALANGVLFGGSGDLPEEIQADFSRTGMTHIVAVSGYNVTIIAEYLIIFGIWLGLWRKQAIWFAITGITLFVIMTGLPASAVRAGVMGTMLLWAMKHGRLANAENGIIFAAAIMLYVNPLLLRWDVGFQLSFLATLGIVLTSSFWERSFIKHHKALGISEAIAMSLSAQLFVLPIIAYNFHMTSMISLFANILILPVIPFSMLMIFLVSFASLFFDFLAMIFAWLAYIPLYYVIKIVEILSRFPLASVEIKSFTGTWMIVYYLILASVIYLEKTKLKKEMKL